MTHFFSGIQKFQGLCTLHPLHSFRQRKTSNHTAKKLIETHFQSRKMYKLFLPTCWKVDHGRQTPGEFVASACVAGAAFGHWTFECEKDLVCQLLFGIYSKHRPKNKDLQPAKNELAAINVELMDFSSSPIAGCHVGLDRDRLVGCVHPADVLHEVCGLLTFGGVQSHHELRIHGLADSKQLL